MAWIDTAKEHGETFTEDDWIALVQELAKRAAKPPIMGEESRRLI